MLKRLRERTPAINLQQQVCNSDSGKTIVKPAGERFCLCSFQVLNTRNVQAIAIYTDIGECSRRRTLVCRGQTAMQSLADAGAKDFKIRLNLQPMGSLNATSSASYDSSYNDTAKMKTTEAE
ncbi:MAG: hypothetical protein OXE85_12565 [Roseovarius sp.]|nr:hypothetical protein [Roseovarius sp.]